MMKRLSTALLATAATAGAFALALPATANAATRTTATQATTASSSDYDYDDYWGAYLSSNGRAKASGWIGVEWDRRQESNEVHVRGKLYDLDHRTYRQGGKCGYVKFAVHHFGDDDGDWFDGRTYKYCGAGGFKSFSFAKEDVQSIRVKVCQIGLSGSYPTRCGGWEYLYTSESE
ncbi:hypothetical protein ACQPYK_34370 [Streptosporangium sp. CA-135522]|uniref:hypothetical protein n=1 Tax=Streptosporangium sp. CA-135522 TaxID=3240072 RepID=UPI003D8F0763